MSQLNNTTKTTTRGTVKRKVFLGGTCDNSVWRELLMPRLKIDYFNPVVKDWTEACMAEERRQRDVCDYMLYVITPAMSGVYSIAEVVDDSNKKPDKTIFCILDTDSSTSNTKFSASQLKSLEQVGEMVKRNGGTYLRNLDDVAEYLNRV